MNLNTVQSLQILAQLINQTRALPGEHAQLAAALDCLAKATAAPDPAPAPPKK